MMKKRRKKISSPRRRWTALVLCLFMGSSLWLSGCSEISFGDNSSTKVVLTAGFGGEEVFRISKSSCTKPELMVYLTNMQNQYENVYGEDIWDAGADDITLEQKLKDTVIARIAQVKTMALLAEQYEVALSDKELKNVEKASEAYYDSLNETEIAKMNITRETVRGLYTDFALANAVYDKIIQDVNPEISDDEARTITVRQVVLHNYTTDEQGNRIEDTEAEQKEDRKIAKRILRHLQKGEDFALLAEKYSDEENITVSFGKGEVNEVLEEAAFNLGTDEVSDIVETDEGFYILKCISTFDVKQTDANKEKIIRQRKKEAFNDVYNQFVSSLNRSLNEELWEKITMIHDEAVTTSDFFAVYEKYCGQEEQSASVMYIRDFTKNL